MEFTLPFNLLPHLEGTDLAKIYGLRNDGATELTIINLDGRGDAREFVTELKKIQQLLQVHLLDAERKMRATAAPPIVGQKPRIEVQKVDDLRMNLHAVRITIVEVSKRLPPPHE